MIRVAVIEDEIKESDRFSVLINQYALETKTQLTVNCFSDAVKFFDSKGKFDIVFMDIQLPIINGMRAAKKLRVADEKVAIVFITNMPEFVFNGYEVSALDYILKPLGYARLKTVMNKAVRYFASHREQEIIIRTNGGIKRMYTSSIAYIEIRGHILVYHTNIGDIECWSSLSEIEKEYAKYNFVRCNRGTLVNLSFVDEVCGNEIIIEKTQIRITNGCKLSFMQALSRYFGK